LDEVGRGMKELYTMQCNTPVGGVALTTLELEVLVRLEPRVWHSVRILKILIRLPVKSAVWIIQ
jgi:hypothetical protein